MSQVTGLQETLAGLSTFENLLIEKVKQEIAFTALEVLNEAKSNTPIDTGILRGSGSMDVKDNGLSATVSFSAEYAPFVEFGTGGEVQVPSGWEDFAIQFKGKGIRVVNAPARPYLIPAFEKGVKDLNGRILKLTVVNRRI